ncbi:succinate dehydrogenase cytochrome b subunit [Cesiribacter sp. SM1]|uniref:succinate dehydrogenase cytochrome b subunit n=1 Tax=Cesiribacter sp. SM1 TaxID=2861196 RepID=UPI001CD25E8B|nr:succinate dehydrogenase cytochrome b subunit [Cesiribacter sp. SM1]
MSWLTQTFSSSIGRKFLTAITGLFLIFFLVGHVTGNLLLFKPDEGRAFNEYTQFMTGNLGIMIVRYLLYAAILAHVIITVLLGIHNRKARPVGYTKQVPSPHVSWSSRNMGILGTLVLVFIVIHMANFWYSLKWGVVPTVNYAEAGEIKNLYHVVQSSFSELWYTALYVVMMVFLAFHLMHGFQSAFQTLGLRHKKYWPIIRSVGFWFSIIVPFIFALMPLYIYFFRNINH